ncbi:hypothetical protein BGX26_003938 [Mortierella sp. AD094]|nr:hypothetical protein BGX26_003938 [Mortierella sp. AD094]
MSKKSSEAKPRPDVLIIGASIPGLTLAILLEQVSVPYHVYERAAEVKPLEGKVHIHCSDNTSYTGDILVGADGAYSGVRQSMFKCMNENEKGFLFKADPEDFTINYTTTVGVATPSNPEKYPKPSRVSPPGVIS